MDLQSVALKLSVSIEDVKTHYNRYKDPFKPIKVEPIFSFLAVCISIGSIFLSIETLDEMKKERELAYKPDLRVYENDISLYWNEKGEQTKRLDSYSRQYQTNKENVLYAVYLNIDNIGTGNAKDIKYNWNYEENINNFNLFLGGSGVEANLLENDNLVEISNKEKWGVRFRMIEEDIESYIFQGMQKRVMIPSAYLSLLSMYCYEKLPLSSEIKYNKPLTMQDFPKLYLTISYRGIQGEEIKKKVEIGFEPVIYEKELSGEGNCTLRVRNLNEEILIGE